MLEEAGIEPRIVFEADDVATLRGFVAAGLGVTVIPRSGEVAGPGTLAGAVVHVAISDVPSSRQIDLLWLPDQRLLPAADLFRRHVVASAPTVARRWLAR